MKRTHDRTHRASTVNTAHKSLVHCTSIPSVLGAREVRGAREEGGRETPAKKPLFSPSRLLIMYAKITQL